MEKRLAELAALKARIEARKTSLERTDFAKVEIAATAEVRKQDEAAEKSRRITKPLPGRWGSSLTRYRAEQPIRQRNFWLLYLNDDLLLRILSFLPDPTSVLGTCRRFAHVAQNAPFQWRGRNRRLYIDGRLLSLHNLDVSVCLGRYGSLADIHIVVLHNFYAYPPSLFSEVVRACPQLKQVMFVSCARIDPPQLPNHVSISFSDNPKDTLIDLFDPAQMRSLSSTYRFQMSSGLPDLQGLSRRSMITHQYSISDS